MGGACKDKQQYFREPVTGHLLELHAPLLEVCKLQLKIYVLKLTLRLLSEYQPDLMECKQGEHSYSSAGQHLIQDGCIQSWYPHRCHLQWNADPRIHQVISVDQLM